MFTFSYLFLPLWDVISAEKCLYKVRTLFFLRLCMLREIFSRFPLLHDKKKCTLLIFFHIFLLLSWKLFWFCCCCLVSSLVTWNAVCFFFGNWHQQSAPFSRTAKWLVIFISKNFKAKNLKTVNFCRDRKTETSQFDSRREFKWDELNN